MQTWTFEVPVRFEQIGRLMPLLEDNLSWKYAFRRIPNLISAELCPPTTDVWSPDMIFTLAITDLSHDKARNRIESCLARGIKVRKLGHWAPIRDGIKVVEQRCLAKSTPPVVVLTRDEVDDEKLREISEILERLCETNAWNFSGWRFEMTCTCGDIEVRLMRFPPDTQFVAIHRGESKQSVVFGRVKKDLERAFRQVLEEPPAQSSR